VIGSLRSFNPTTSIGFIAVAGLPRNGCAFRLSDCQIDPAMLRPGLLVEFVLDDDPGAVPGQKFVAREVRRHVPHDVILDRTTAVIDAMAAGERLQIHCGVPTALMVSRRCRM
jgi:hypothetical protein